jgi:fumarate reductase subunit C
MDAVDMVIGIGWAVFWIYWIAVSLGVKAGRSRWTRFAGFRVAAVLIILLLLRLRVLKGHTVTHDPWLQGNKQSTKMLVPFIF